MSDARRYAVRPDPRSRSRSRALESLNLTSRPRGTEKPDFWPVTKLNTGSLPLRGNPVGKKNKHHIFAPTAGAHCATFPNYA